MQDSILVTIRKLVCGDPYANHFDADLLVHINACFSVLNQLGVGPEKGFVVTDENAEAGMYGQYGVLYNKTIWTAFRNQAIVALVCCCAKSQHLLCRICAQDVL